MILSTSSGDYFCKCTLVFKLYIVLLRNLSRTNFNFITCVEVDISSQKLHTSKYFLSCTCTDASNFKHKGVKMFSRNHWPNCQSLVKKLRAIYKQHGDWISTKWNAHPSNRNSVRKENMNKSLHPTQRNTSLTLWLGTWCEIMVETFISHMTKCIHILELSKLKHIYDFLGTELDFNEL